MYHVVWFSVDKGGVIKVTVMDSPVTEEQARARVQGYKASRDRPPGTYLILKESLVVEG